MRPILSVEKNIKLHNVQVVEWAKCDVDIQRVDTMHEAITRLMRGEEFLFISINEESVPELWEPLRIMRDITNHSIFVIPSAYTMEKKIRALNYGADMYEAFNTYDKENVLYALEFLKLQSRWANRQLKSAKILVGGEVILSPPHRRVFVRDAEVKLTRIDFDILRYLMLNAGIVLTPKQIFRKVWGAEYEESDLVALWAAIKRLRDKLKNAANGLDYIETVRDVGYRFKIK